MQDNNIRIKYRPDPKLYSQHGDTMDFTCLSGYEAPPGTQMRITCEHGKLQYPNCFKTGFCVLDQPTMITHNIHYTTSTIVENGQTISFQCNEEMIPEDNLEAKCVSGRIIYPKCIAASPCKIFTENLNLYNIQLLPSDNSGNDPDITHRHGTRLRVTCKSGFRRPDEAAMVIKCSNGNFRYPRCFAGSTCRIDQDELDRKNLELDEVHGNEVFYEENESVHFKCKTGYYRRTKPIAKCSGETLIYPSCTGIGAQCGPPPVIQYGDTISFNKPFYRSGESVEYKCPEYYHLQGNRIVRCLNGVWDEAPVCLEPCTAKEKDMQDNNIRIRYRSDRKLYSQHGDTMDFTCLSGYEAPPGTQMRITCQQGKLQYPKCFKTGFCVLDEPTMIIHNIHYTTSTIVDNGQTITFQCHEEMIPEDNLEAKCVSGRINYPKCIAAKSCNTPEIINGFLKTEPKASYDSGSYVQYECNKDYVTNGPINVRCENGQWTELPVCYSPCRIFTEDLDLNNIQLLPSDYSGNDPDIPHRHGTQLRVTCKSGFRRPNQAALTIECYDGRFRYTRCFSGSTCRIDQDELDRNNLELDDVHDNEVFYEENERVHFTCKTGYYRRTKPIAKCSRETLIYPSCTAQSSG